MYVLFGRPLFPSAGELFEHTKSRAEWQTVFPKNLLRLIVFVFVTSLFGLLLDLAGAVSWLGLPCAAAGGLAFNFLLSTVFSPLRGKLQKISAADSKVEVWVVPTNEELLIARDTRDLVGNL